MGIFSFLKFTKKLENYKLFKILGVDNIIIVLIMLLFSLFGAIFGMSEECIAFIIIIIPLAISMGYDSIVGVCMVYVAAHVGFAGAILNPFTIGIAQGIAEVPLFSGIGYRIFCWFVLNIVLITFVLLYAKKVKKNPKSSIMYEEDAYWITTDSTCNLTISGGGFDTRPIKDKYYRLQLDYDISKTVTTTQQVWNASKGKYETKTVSKIVTETTNIANTIEAAPLSPALDINKN